VSQKEEAKVEKSGKNWIKENIKWGRVGLEVGF